MSAAALWRLAATLAAPALPFWLARRAARGKEFPARLAERRGIATLARPPGPLLWLHAASVGETQSVIPLIQCLKTHRPDLAILFTTATVTAARLLPDRLGLAADPAASGAMRGASWLVHQFAPLDVPAWLDRFLDHWRPDAAAFVESELWPSALSALRRRGVPTALVNARMSPRSAARWRLAPGLARDLLSGFDLILPQSAGDSERLARLGARALAPPGNLKLAAPPLPVDEAEHARLAALYGTDPVWAAASTHPGEEELVLEAHRLALAEVPRLRLILAPRHPERGAAVAEAALAAGFAVPRRSCGQDPAGPVWIADTIGELGLIYRLALGAFVGGSLVPKGGQNPLEPARLGRPVAFGQHTGNFAEIAETLCSAGGATEVADARALAAWAVRLARDPAWREGAGKAAAAAAALHQGVLDRTVVGLLRLLPAGGGKQDT